VENVLKDSQDQRERSLIAAAIRGESDALRALWQEYRRWVAVILLAHKPREVDLEDLLQDVAMTFVRTIGELRDEAALKPWLRTVSINAARASGRKVRTQRRHFAGAVSADAGIADAGRSVEHDEATNEEAQRLMSLAMEMPEGYREPLLLRCVRGMSYRAIAELLSLPETTIETRIARGRRMLRELAKADAESSQAPEAATGAATGSSAGLTLGERE
jgi:RNA polymerase sigma-70 factor, ECF subfamily